MIEQKIICAVDTADLRTALRISEALEDKIGGIKLGLEFFLANGAWGVRYVAPKRLFLDLKLHDIPQTVAGGLNSVLSLLPEWLTVHVSGGPEMLKRSVDLVGNYAAKHGIKRTKLLGVTVLTSLNDQDLALLGQPPVAEQVLRLAEVAQMSGLDGIVASPMEIKAVRARCGSDFMIVTPGIRPFDRDRDDQKRTMTPFEAISSGADLLVMGRPLRHDPAFALYRITKDFEHQSSLIRQTAEEASLPPEQAPRVN